MKTKIILTLTILLIAGICIGADRSNPNTLRARVEALESQLIDIADRLEKIEATFAPSPKPRSG